MNATTALVPTDADAKAARVEREVAIAKEQAEAIEVVDQAGADNAGALLREIQRRRKAAEKERVELTKPLLDTKRKIDKRFKDAMAPFDIADEIVRGKLGAYTAEQIRVRAAEEARLEAERQERERKAREARERQEAEERERRERAERERREAEEEARKARDAEDRAAAEALAEEARRKAEEAEVAERAIASLPEVSLPRAVVEPAPRQEGISTRKVWRTEITDDAAIPRRYLMVDRAAIRQAVRDGVREIPGVRIWQEEQLAVRGGDA